MGVNVAKEIARLKAMTVPELRARYAEVFGEECRSRHKQFLWKRMIWRMQANEEGDLSGRARRRAEGLANDADLRLNPPKIPVAATADLPVWPEALQALLEVLRLPTPHATSPLMEIRCLGPFPPSPALSFDCPRACCIIP